MFALRPGWFALMVFVWVIGTFLGSTYENQNTTNTWAGSGSGSTVTSASTTLGEIVAAQKAVQQNVIVGAIKVVTNSNFWDAVYRIITWQWSFQYDSSGNFVGGFFYWIFLFPFVCMGILSSFILLWGLLRGNITFG